MNPDEVWLPAIGFPDYAVSSHGRLKRVTGGQGALAGHVLRPSLNMKGYPCTRLYGRTLTVHRLVARAFHGEPPKGKPHVRHLDNDPTNNRAENLAWGSRQDNADDRVAAGRCNPSAGEGHYAARLTEDAVRAIRREYPATTAKELATRYGVAVSTVYTVAYGCSWRHVL